MMHDIKGRIPDVLSKKLYILFCLLPSLVLPPPPHAMNGLHRFYAPAVSQNI